tara:strand:- start:128 stop:331 length:204 start_codon:yes stop_codon:yes gene_type:complete
MKTYHPIRSDSRYSVRKEFCGHEKPRYVLRFCGDFIDSFTSLPSATLRAACHRAIMNGAPVYTNKEA